MYSTTVDTKGGKESTHKKSKSKHQSNQDSAKKSKRYKNKKTLSKHIMPNTSRNLHKKQVSTLSKSKRNDSAKGSRNEKSYTNVLITNDMKHSLQHEYSRSSYLGQQSSFDLVSIKKPIHNISPGKLISYKSKADFGANSMIVPYNEAKLSSKSDLKRLEELRQNARSYTDLHNNKLKSSYL